MWKCDRDQLLTRLKYGPEIDKLVLDDGLKEINRLYVELSVKRTVRGRTENELFWYDAYMNRKQLAPF